MTPDELQSRGRSGTGALATAAWLLVGLVLARAGVVAAIELAHHGDLARTGLRLARGLGEFALLASALSLLGAVAQRERAPGWFRSLASLALAGATYFFLVGRLDADPSRRVGSDTTLGLVAHGIAAAAGLVFGALPFAARAPLVRNRLSSPAGVLVPLGLLALVALVLRLGFGGLGARMTVQSLERGLAAGVWEVSRSHPEGPPVDGVLCPSVKYRVDGAAREAVLLPPPARVSHRLVEGGSSLWLIGAAGIDHTVPEDLPAELASGAVRFRVAVDGRTAFEATLALRSAPTWAALGEGLGLRVEPGARLELATDLVDVQGHEIAAAFPLRVGFGGLGLVRREELARTRASRERPNVVLVVLDTLRADRTSAYGYARATTPHLAGLAQRGLVFEEACATASWTWPSTASILTGLLPEEHGVQDAGSSILAQGFDTLAESLQRAGLTTAAWSGSPLIVPEKGFDQGFEFFDASREGLLRRSGAVVPAALEWLGAAERWRFFLYLHLMEPHAPLVPLEEGRALFARDVPKSFDPRKPVDYSWDLLREGFSESGERRTERIVPAEEQRWISDLYDACVWSADDWLGRLVARLDELGQLENTVIAVTSDHGEELFDHGLLSHSHSLHRELVRVPLVLAGPGVPAGERVRSPVSLTGIGPTLARLAGTTLAEPVSGADLLDGEGGGEAPILFSTQQGWWNGRQRQPLFGLRRGSIVLHLAPQGSPWGEGPSQSDGDVRMFDLERDPGETKDLAAADPGGAQALRAELEARLLELSRGQSGISVPPDEATLEVLRQLGYVGK